MPFTVSHVAAVLPVVSRHEWSRGVPAAFVVGSMVPDVPWFFTAGRGAHETHTLRGLVTTDLVLGLVLFALWRLLLAAPVRDLAPPVLGRRLPVPRALAPTGWLMAAVGVLTGAATHLLWDAFTHGGRWGVELVGALGAEHAGLPGYKWAQYASGVVGGGMLLVWCVRRLRCTPPGPVAERGVGPRGRLVAWVVVVGLGALGAAYGLLTGGAGVEVALFRAVTRGGAAATGVAVLVCVVWWAIRRPTDADTSRLNPLHPGDNIDNLRDSTDGKLG